MSIKTADLVAKELTLQRLGLFSTPQIQNINTILRGDAGVFSVCGNSGTGKTTLLQTLMAQIFLLHGSKKRICTIESPVEYPMPFATQIDDQKDIWFDANTLNRYDVFMIGERVTDDLRNEVIRRKLNYKCQIWLESRSPHPNSTAVFTINKDSSGKRFIQGFL